MKIAIITDTHAGIKNGSDIFLDYADRFYSEVFFPYCLDNNIKQVLHCGDYFDNRRVVNYKVLNRNRFGFLDKLREYGMTMDIIPGNHDVFYKNTNDVCSLVEILKNHNDVVNIYMTPTVKTYDGLDIALLPWINSENYDASINFIQSAAAPILAGHLELSGFEMMKGAPAMSHGMNAQLLERYQMVLSGHYHTKSTKGNIHYLGVGFEQTWADCNDPKYFHVLDTSSRKLTSIRNHLTLFKRLVYDDSSFVSAAGGALAAIHRADLSHVAGSFVKVIVNCKKDPVAFDAYIDKIVSYEPFEYKIIENLNEYMSSSVDDEAININGDTISLLNSYVDAVESHLDKDRIKRTLHQLFVEAQTLDCL